MPTLLSLVTLSCAYWVGVAVFAGAAVSGFAWLALYATCLAAAIPLWASSRGSQGVGWWLAAGFYSVLFSAIFFGADGALTALHGAHRAKAHVAESLGGLELWFVLCPGVLSVALASALKAFLRGHLHGHVASVIESTSPVQREAVGPTVRSNPSIERTSSGRLRLLPAAAHVER